MHPHWVALTLQGAWTTCTLMTLKDSWSYSWQMKKPFSVLSICMCLFDWILPCIHVKLMPAHKGLKLWLFLYIKCFDYTFVCQVSADWERASLRPSVQPSSVFKPSPVMGTYTTEGGFINTNLVTTDEESQEFDDLIFALKTGEDSLCFILCVTSCEHQTFQ